MPIKKAAAPKKKLAKRPAKKAVKKAVKKVSRKAAKPETTSLTTNETMESSPIENIFDAFCNEGAEPTAEHEPTHSIMADQVIGDEPGDTNREILSASDEEDEDEDEDLDDDDFSDEEDDDFDDECNE
jgi:hypothetical protein